MTAADRAAVRLIDTVSERTGRAAHRALAVMSETERVEVSLARATHHTAKAAKAVIRHYRPGMNLSEMCREAGFVAAVAARREAVSRG